MSNLVIYRKYRPKTFGEIIGQEHIIRTLTNSISAGRISHAYLFSGPRGTGKTTVARLLSKSINCQSPKDYRSPAGAVKKKAEPDNKCSSCVEINDGNSMDLVEIDAASNRGIDEIRSLREGIKFSPVKLKYKVFIIDEAHMLTKEAFNALLKTLEEPPAHAVFILATTEVHKIIPTILSRCQRFDFRKLKINEIVKRLENIALKEKIKFENKALHSIAINAEGGIRDAESMLGQIISLGEKKITLQDVEDILGASDISEVAEYVGDLIRGDLKKALSNINKISEQGKDIQQFIKSVVNYLRKIMLLKIDDSLSDIILEEVTEDDLKIIEKQSEEVSLKDLSNMVRCFISASGDISKYPFPQIALELASVEVIGDNKPVQAADSKEVKEVAVEEADSFVEDVKSKWDEISEIIKPVNHSLSAFLKAACPQKIDNGVLIIAAKYGFHKDRLQQDRNRLAIEKAIADVSKRNIKIKCVLG